MTGDGGQKTGDGAFCHREDAAKQRRGDLADGISINSHHCRTGWIKSLVGVILRLLRKLAMTEKVCHRERSVAISVNFLVIASELAKRGNLRLSLHNYSL